MSFQGDVAGIGLGELLQSLARGGQDGVLRLFGDESSSVLGIRGGMLFLLPGPDEDDEELRLRCQRAWCDDPDPQFEAKRREDIAHASRIDTLYELIGATNVHFRFEPGRVPLPEVPAGYIGSEATVPWAQGLSVEYVLLEHARLSDESQGGADRLTLYDIPRILDVRQAPENLRPFAEHCTGRSTMRELSDRMGWTFIQTAVMVAQLMRLGVLRLAEPRELLVAAQFELTQKRLKRGVDRLTAWVWLSPAGPPDMGDAELLLTEWSEGELESVLGDLKPPVARALLRKMDLADPDRQRSIERWRAQRKAHRRDNVAAVHLAAFQLEDGGLAESTALSDFMRLIRAFDEDGKVTRARALLRMATAEVPESDKSRIELAVQMLELGMQDQGVEWLLDVARDLIDDRKGDRALGPIREVLREIPGLPEARDLLEEAQQQGIRRRRRKVHMMIGAATMLLFGGVAAVQYQSRRDYESRLAEVTDVLDDPRRALEVLATNFGADDSPRVVALRSKLSEQKTQLERDLHAAWIEEFEAIRTECEVGDPLVGLERTLNLESPPELDGPHPGFPARSEILNLLANRLEELIEEVNPAVDASEDELEAETRIVTLFENVLDRSRSEVGNPDVEAFHLRVNEINGVLAFRRGDRYQQREALAQRELEEQQDHLLAAARAHAKEGSLQKAADAFQRLTALDDTEELAPLLDEEISKVRVQLDAVGRARHMAAEGRHEEAIAELEEHCQKPSLYALPWRLVTSPPGVDVRFSDGTVHTTPCIVDSRIDEELTLALRLVGYEDVALEIDQPSDLDVHMHRLPDRLWDTGHRIDAAPVPIGDDHIVADRFGRIARLTAEGTARWTVELETLAGVARTPVFLPDRPGLLLVISEDAKTWLVEASTGAVEGPWEHSENPVDGPTLTRHGVSVRFADDQIALWTDRLVPEMYGAVTTYTEAFGGRSGEHALPGNVAILRRGPDKAVRFASPWTDWRVEAAEDEYQTTVQGVEGVAFTVRREGDWVFLAWEAPNALIPEGRLWVSDDGGLRCFLPVRGIMAQHDRDPQ